MKLVLIILTSVFAFGGSIPEYLIDTNSIFFDKPVFHQHDNLEDKFKLQSFDNYNRPYDIQSIDLSIDWTNIFDTDGVSKTWTGKGEYFVTFQEEVDFIELDAVDLLIDKVEIIEYSYEDLLIEETLDITENIEHDGEILKINFTDLPELLQARLIIDYSFVNHIEEGFYAYEKNANPSVPSRSNPEVVAYTQSQPFSARRWLPCNDYPNDKAITAIDIKVPKGIIASSNGLLLDSLEEGDYITYFWGDNKPMPSYLMVANASKYNYWDEHLPYASNPEEEILITNYYWEEDYDRSFNDHNYSATFFYNFIEGQMETFQKYLGDYPFQKFSTVPVAPYKFGGMEHQTIQTVNRNSLWGNSTLIAHELGHMWLGDLVTCEKWVDIWLNEGGAVFCEILDRQYNNTSHNQFISKLNQVNQLGYIRWGGMSLAPIYEEDRTVVFSTETNPLIYAKAGYVYHLLRMNLGNEEFFRILKGYLNEFSLKNASTQDFISYFKENLNVTPKLDLDEFFDQWLFSSGHPVYTLTAHEKESDNYIIEINQVQSLLDNFRSDSKVVYKSDLRIALFGENGLTDTVSVFNDRQTQSIVYASKIGQIDSLAIDPEYVLHETGNVIVTNVESSKDENFLVYPTIINRDQKLNIEIDQNDLLTELAIYDVLGNQVYKLEAHLSKSSKFSIDLDLPKGKYFVRSSSVTNIKTRPFVII